MGRDQLDETASTWPIEPDRVSQQGPGEGAFITYKGSEGLAIFNELLAERDIVD